jgi:transposase
MRYDWVWIYAYVCPATGDTFWLILPTVNAELMSLSLKEFALHCHIGPNNRIILVMDQAGFHTAKDINVPEGIHLFYLPSHTPELQPAERLWAYTDEPLANRYFADIETLTNVLSARCKDLAELTTTIKSLCNYDWIQRINAKHNTLGN